LDYRREPVHVVIAEQALRDPAAVAATFEGEQMSYGTLDRRAGRLARRLRALGVGHQDVVAVSLDRGLDAIVALVGVLKAGAAFAVVDPTIPTRRQQFILGDTATGVVVTRSDLLASLPEPEGWAPLCLDTDPSLAASVDTADADVIDEWATGDSLAYVLYTSGTTGTPKGVLIEHRALMLFLASFTQQFELGPHDRLLQYASLVFDLSEAEIFAALTNGATLVLGSADTLLSPEALATLIRDEQVTYVGAPPAMLELLEAGPYPELRGVLGAGEAFSGELVNRWNVDGRRFYNGYGPTETAIGCVAYECERVEWRSSPPIGTPLPHRRLYVVDRWGAIAPTGVPGELLIGGDEGVARGYLNQPALTAERFVPDPFRPDAPDARVYRSGDLVRWSHDGQLEFIGRIDNQVKLRGLRIELEEIEAVLAAHPDVGRAVVALREDTPGKPQIVAYVVAQRPGVAVADLRTHVGSELPAYMIPSAWVFLDAVPLSIAGKVDRRALPVPEVVTTDQVTLAPRTPTEAIVASAFAGVLGLDAVGATDSFFELGGTSLQAIRLASGLSDVFQVGVTVRSVYGAPTVDALATTIAGLGGTIPTDRDGAPSTSSASSVPARAPQIMSRHRLSTAPSTLVAIRAVRTRPPLVWVHPVSGSVFPYVGLARLLPEDQPVHGLEAPGLHDSETPLARVEDLASRHLAALEQHLGTVPCILAGWSMGGVVAFEMARQLVAEGRTVAQLVLVDSPAPTASPVPADAEILAGYGAHLAASSGHEAPEPGEVAGGDAGTRDVAALFERLRGAEHIPAELDLATFERRFAVFRANVLALHGYQATGPYAGDITLVRAAESPDASAGWIEHAGIADPATLRRATVPGTHYSIWAEPGLSDLALSLTTSVDAAHAASTLS
ncbi:MAG: amino acid adenylation domain-containing protein, partial [Acidimicrobiia bacterium]|nr:amino acid adenylation domain-containing protein [Acidimicrobiia bacterium]